MLAGIEAQRLILIKHAVPYAKFETRFFGDFLVATRK